MSVVGVIPGSLRLPPSRFNRPFRPGDIWPALASRKIVGVEMAYAFHQQSSFQPGSNRAEVSQVAEIEKVLRFGQGGCLLER